MIDLDNTQHIVDRAKDVIKSGGKWISPQALEDAATRHPAIQEAAVVAVPHPRWQERPFLILVRREDQEVSAEDLRAHLLQHVPKWWLPDYMAFVADLPHGPTGKLQKEALRRQVAEGLIVPMPLSRGPLSPA